MRPFYQDVIVHKSWEMLQAIKRQFDFVLIGGWAVYLYTGGLKSKDIDLIVDFDQLSKLKKNYDVYKNERLKKYEVKREGIDIDIYLPYFSDLGFPIEEILKHTQTIKGFTLPQKEVLLITKLKAYVDRKASLKGQKDQIDCISLMVLEDFDFELYKNLIQRYKFTHYQDMLDEILAQTREVKELNLNKHFFAKKKKEILATLRS